MLKVQIDRYFFSRINQGCFGNPHTNQAYDVKINFLFRIATIGVFLLFAAFPLHSDGAENGAAPVQLQSGVSEMLDSLVNATYFQDDRFVPVVPGAERDIFPRQFIPQFTDSVYTARISELGKKTPFKLVFNEHVRGYIRVYSVDKRKMMSKMLGLTKVYFPLFEEKLKEYNIPVEMKYLAIVESALNPTAVSHAGARGLWQFMSGTGRMYGLQSSSFIEDRYDPYKSTIAACEHLKDLYDLYGDWLLVLAAYNSGAGTVNRAIRASGGVKDYWAIWHHLPQETRGYVPAFIAVNYVMSFYREHNLQPIEPGMLYSDAEAVRVSSAVSFDQLKETIGVPVEDLKFLNPQYKLDLVPASESLPGTIRLPKQYVHLFTQNEKDIYAYESAKTRERLRLYGMLRNMDTQDDGVASRSQGRTKGSRQHVVRRGETLASIARKYRCNVSQLIAWNDLKGASVRPGQRLVVFRASGVTADNDQGISKKANKKKTDSKQGKSRKEGGVHTVSKGETLAGIAAQHGVSVKELSRWNRLGKKKKLKPGQNLRLSP